MRARLVAVCSGSIRGLDSVPWTFTMQSNNKPGLLLALEKGYGEGAEVTCGMSMAGCNLEIKHESGF